MGTRLTYFDVFIGLMRPVFYAGVAVGFYYLFKYLSLEKQPKIKNYLVVMAIVAMLLYYVLLRMIWYYIFGLTHLGTIDELQLYDKSTNKSIIMASCYFDKCNADIMLDLIKTRMLKYKVLRSKFVKVFDQFYLKEMSKKELDECVAGTYMKLEKCYKGEDIKEDKDLCRFLEREATIPFEDGDLPYKVYLVQDYSENESVLMWKCHHGLSDGMALMGLMTSL